MRPEVTLLALILVVLTERAHCENTFELIPLRDMDEWLPEVDETCVIAQPAPYELLLTCRTLSTNNIECKVNVYQNRKHTKVLPANVTLEGPCLPLDNASLPASQTELLNALKELVKGKNDRACALELMETLDLRSSGLGHLKGGECGKGRCPYQLQNLFIAGSALRTLDSGSFCQFQKLENLLIENSALYEINEEALSHLKGLVTLSLKGNGLDDLPEQLFSKNTKLEFLFLNKNKFGSRVLSVLKPLKNLYVLNLDDNQIDSIDYDSSIFDNSRLSELYVRNNLLENVSSVLVPLKMLKVLNLSKNRISHVASNAFRRLTSILTIDLSDNRLKTFENETFAENYKMKELILENNRLIDFPSINYLINLKTLILANNRLESIKKSDVKNCTSLQLLNFSNNRIESIEIGAFDTIEKIKSLDLSRNRLTGWALTFRKSFIQNLILDFNELKKFSFDDCPNELKSISIRYNRLDTIDSFINERKWNLSRVDLSHNLLKGLQDLRLPNTVEELDLRANGLMSWGLIGDERAERTQLRVIDLRHNNMSEVCYRAILHFRSPYKIKYQLTGNSLKCSCANRWIKQWFSTPNYVISDFDDLTCEMTSSLKGHERKKFKNLSDEHFRLCPSGPYFSCQYNTSSSCQTYSDQQLSIVQFHCRNRNLTSVPELTHHAEPTVRLDLTGNDLKVIKREDFRNLNQLENLVLASSNIEILEPDAFHDLPNLKTLNLYNNKLKELPEVAFQFLKQLKVLDLSENELKTLKNGTLVPLISLLTLNLSGNRFQRLPVESFSKLGSLASLTLHNNPWTCECEFVEPFRNFLANHTYSINGPQELFCRKGQVPLNLLRFDMSLCRTLLNVTALSASLALASALATAAILLFVYRKEVQVLVYARYGLRMLRRNQPEAEVEGKQYDAFMAYNSKDEDFLLNELLPGLEGIERPYRLCIHERDFPAGSFIQDSIMDAITMSSRTIVILSRNFVKSGWCRFEFKSAHAQMMEDRCPRVLVIVLGEVPEQLDPEMQLYLKTNTYLTWGERLFWQKLYYAMPDLRVTSPPTEIMPMRIM